MAEHQVSLLETNTVLQLNFFLFYQDWFVFFFDVVEHPWLSIGVFLYLPRLAMSGKCFPVSSVVTIFYKQ